jgi:hypothetical protein
MDKITDNIALNGNAGAFVDLVCTRNSRRVVIQEDKANGAAVGIDYTLPIDNFTAVHTIMPTDQPLDLSQQIGVLNGMGGQVGQVAQQKSSGLAMTETIPATVYAKLRSHTAATTKAAMRECD